MIQKKPSYITFHNIDHEIYFQTLSNKRSQNKELMKTIKKKNSKAFYIYVTALK